MRGRVGQKVRVCGFLLFPGPRGELVCKRLYPQNKEEKGDGDDRHDRRGSGKGQAQTQNVFADIEEIHTVIDGAEHEVCGDRNDASKKRMGYFMVFSCIFACLET